jgi:hypothetical protein
MLKKFTAKIESALTDRTNEVEEQLLIPDGRYQELIPKSTRLWMKSAKACRRRKGSCCLNWTVAGSNGTCWPTDGCIGGD